MWRGSCGARRRRRRGSARRAGRAGAARRAGPGRGARRGGSRRRRPSGCGRRVRSRATADDGRGTARGASMRAPGPGAVARVEGPGDTLEGEIVDRDDLGAGRACREGRKRVVEHVGAVRAGETRELHRGPPLVNRVVGGAAAPAAAGVAAARVAFSDHLDAQRAQGGKELGEIDPRAARPATGESRVDQDAHSADGEAGAACLSEQGGAQQRRATERREPDVLEAEVEQELAQRLAGVEA